MERINRKQLTTMMTRGDDFELVEVLGSDQFRMRHIPNAINVPLGDDFAQDIQHRIPDKNTAVVVYCASAECDASPKAARTLDALGYRAVYDYGGGKADWAQAGLPLDGGSD